MMNEETRTMIEGHGYTDLREINGLICGVHRYIYTCGVCVGLDETGYSARICFDTMQNAQLFLKDWDGGNAPEVGTDGCTAVK